jgi:hypothetical protein
MNKKITILAMLSALLLMALFVTSAVAQSRAVGVSVADWFKYGDIAGSWSSNDPNATIPDFAFNETEWMTMSVQSIVGTNVTGQMTIHYSNGTEEYDEGWIDVDTGEGEEGLFWLISENLNAGHTIYSSANYSTMIINETITRTYLSGIRDTNHLNITIEYQMSNGIEYYLYMSMNFYWDRTTGVLVEWSQEYISQIDETQTSWSYTINITESNMWIIPEFPTWITILPILIILTVSITLCKRRLHKTHTTK